MSRYEHETFLDYEREEARNPHNDDIDDDGPSRAELNAELERDALERQHPRVRRFEPLTRDNWDAAVREQRARENRKDQR